MTKQDTLTLAEAASHFPRKNGKKVHIKTLLRRITKGCRGVFLRAVKDGHTWFTTEQWIQEFQEQCTSQAMRRQQAQRSDAAARATADDAMDLFERRYGRGKEQTEAVSHQAVQG